MHRVLFGREADVSNLTAMLESNRLISIVGTGGVGKTALVSQLQDEERIRDRFAVLQIELFAFTDAHQLMPALVGALRLPVSKDQARDTVVAALKAEPHLLVLDNCEHLLPEVADIISDLLKEVAALCILATSQEPLNLKDESVYRLKALPLPDANASLDAARVCGAVALFIDRAQAADQQFSVTSENIAVVIDICRRLDGIPLAIELAAARLRVLGVENLHARLEDRLQLLSSRARDLPQRHRTLRAALEWSWSLLHEDEQTVFRRLGIMSGSFDLDAALAVSCDGQLTEHAVIDALADLCDKSLIMVESQSGGATRYRLLETMRYFALEQLRLADEEAKIRERHLAHFLGLANKAGQALAGPQQGNWLARLDHDRDNLFAAHRACDTLPGGVERGLQLANALIRYWFNRDALLMGQRVMAEALARPGAEPSTLLRAEALVNNGRMLVYRSLDNEAMTFFRQAIDTGYECGALHVVVEAMGRLGYVHITLNDHASARKILEEACGLAEKLDGTRLRHTVVPHSNLAELERLEGNFEAAMRGYEACLAIDIELGDRQATMISLNNLAMSALALRNLPQVRVRLLESLAICNELDSRRGRLVVMEVCAGLAAEIEDWSQAVRFDSAARNLTAALGRRRDIVDEAFLEPRISRARKALGRKPAAASDAEGAAFDYDSAISSMQAWLDSRQDLTSQKSPDAGLTAREQEILSLIARGYPNGDVARLLDISVLTVRTHRQRLMDKLQLHNAAEITAFAVKMGWYDPN